MTELDQLCRLAKLSEKSEAAKAELLIWYAMKSLHRDAAYLPFVVELFLKARFASPNFTRLRRNLISSRRVINRSDKGNDQFSLRRDIEEEFDVSYAAVFEAAGQNAASIFERKLQAEADKLARPIRAFVVEAVGCMKNEYFRAAVVLAWQGAMGLLEQNIFDRQLAAFNAEAKVRNLVKKPIKTLGDFQRLREEDKLLLAEAAGSITKSIRSALEGCLKRRNNCGHPNDFEIGEAQVAAHIESLIKHVFSRV